jgi:hypothetical protein
MSASRVMPVKPSGNYRKLWNSAIEGFTSPRLHHQAGECHTTLPSRSQLWSVHRSYKTLVYGDSVKGYPSLMVTVLFLSGIQLALGVIEFRAFFNERAKRHSFCAGIFPLRVKLSQQNTAAIGTCAPATTTP